MLNFEFFLRKVIIARVMAMTWKYLAETKSNFGFFFRRLFISGKITNENALKDLPWESYDYEKVN